MEDEELELRHQDVISDKSDEELEAIRNKGERIAEISHRIWECYSDMREELRNHWDGSEGNIFGDEFCDCNCLPELEEAVDISAYAANILLGPDRMADVLESIRAREKALWLTASIKEVESGFCSQGEGRE